MYPAGQQMQPSIHIELVSTQTGESIFSAMSRAGSNSFDVQASAIFATLINPDIVKAGFSFISFEYTAEDTKAGTATLELLDPTGELLELAFNLAIGSGVNSSQLGAVGSIFFKISYGWSGFSQGAVLSIPKRRDDLLVNNVMQMPNGELLSEPAWFGTSAVNYQLVKGGTKYTFTLYGPTTPRSALKLMTSFDAEFGDFHNSYYEEVLYTIAQRCNMRIYFHESINDLDGIIRRKITGKLKFTKMLYATALQKVLSELLDENKNHKTLLYTVDQSSEYAELAMEQLQNRIGAFYSSSSGYRPVFDTGLLGRGANAPDFENFTTTVQQYKKEDQQNQAKTYMEMASSSVKVRTQGIDTTPFSEQMFRAVNNVTSKTGASTKKPLISTPRPVTNSYSEADTKLQEIYKLCAQQWFSEESGFTGQAIDSQTQGVTPVTIIIYQHAVDSDVVRRARINGQNIQFDDKKLFPLLVYLGEYNYFSAPSDSTFITEGGTLYRDSGSDIIDLSANYDNWWAATTGAFGVKLVDNQGNQEDTKEDMKQFLGVINSVPKPIKSAFMLIAEPVATMIIKNSWNKILKDYGQPSAQASPLLPLEPGVVTSNGLASQISSSQSVQKVSSLVASTDYDSYRLSYLNSKSTALTQTEISEVSSLNQQIEASNSAIDSLSSSYSAGSLDTSASGNSTDYKLNSFRKSGTYYKYEDRYYPPGKDFNGEQKISLIPGAANATENDDDGKLFDPRYEGKLNVSFKKMAQNMLAWNFNTGVEKRISGAPNILIDLKVPGDQALFLGLNGSASVLRLVVHAPVPNIAGFQSALYGTNAVLTGYYALNGFTHHISNGSFTTTLKLVGINPATENIDAARGIVYNNVPRLNSLTDNKKQFDAAYASATQNKNSNPMFAGSFVFPDSVNSDVGKAIDYSSEIQSKYTQDYRIASETGKITFAVAQVGEQQ